MELCNRKWPEHTHTHTQEDRVLYKAGRALTLHNCEHTHTHTHSVSAAAPPAGVQNMMNPADQLFLFLLIIYQ